MNATNNIAVDLFYKIRSRFSGLKLGSDDGTLTINPDEARFFDFDYKDGGQTLGHVSISIAEENSVKIYFSSGITDKMNSAQSKQWYNFLKELRVFSKRRLLSFDTRDITKDNLDRRDFAFLSKNAQPVKSSNTIIQKHVGENIMRENAMYGSKTMSYQQLMDTRLIIKHNKAVMDDAPAGARARNISALFVENQDGERFKYPFVHLSGARAMQRHVANGGVPYDDIGKSIVEMSEQIAQLRSFSNYVVRNDLMNSSTNGIVEQSSQALINLREQVARLSKQGYYEKYKEGYAQSAPVDVPLDVVEDYTDKFTVKNFKEDIRAVFPILYKLMQEHSKVGYEEIVEMTTSDSCNDDAELDLTEEVSDDLGSFENWVMRLGENGAVASDNDDEQTEALEALQALIDQHFPAGDNGDNAIPALDGLITDNTLLSQIREISKQDPDTDVRPMIQQWINDNVPEVSNLLDFNSDTDAGDDFNDNVKEAGGPNKSNIPAVARKEKDSTNWKMSTRDLDDERTRSPTSSAGLARKKKELEMGTDPRINVKEVAEFIHSFYDKTLGTFPKGPESVCAMVGKKFGEQAESIARKLTERMAPQQNTEHSPKLQELSRIVSLSGIGNEGTEDDDARTGYYSLISQILGKLESGRYADYDGKISSIRDEIANQLEVPVDANFSHAFHTAHIEYMDKVRDDGFDQDSYSDRSMRRGEMGESPELSAIKRLSGISH